jgi:TonB family protein
MAADSAQNAPRDSLRTTAIVITAAVHLGVLAALLVGRVAHSSGPQLKPGTFVDAQLVRFGKPRDLSFLPHKQGVVKNKGPQEAIKVARDLSALPHLDPQKKPDEIDPLKKTHADIFKHLDDQPEGVDNQEGSLTGSRAGTATEARGDPYILQLVDTIGSAWTVPTTIKEAELANLSADVCLTISDSGALTNYKIVRGSGNSQFDSSLMATLSTIKLLPAPPDRDMQGRHVNLRAAARRGILCPTLAKQ